jgi:hypothetical protein
VSDVPGRAAAVAVKEAVQALGGGFMISPEAKAAGKAMGLRGRQLYFGGRCGVLGDVDADVVTAAAAFWPAQVVRESWEGALAVAAPRDIALAYAGVCHAWGRRTLADAPGLTRVAELLEAVAEHATVVAVPLFAGWRALPRPDDPPARVAQLAHVLREHRGGLHALAVLACGLHPLEAIMSGPRGASDARFFGWPEPYPAPEDTRPARERAERLTDDLASAAYAVLDEGDGAELARLLAALVPG